ATTPTSELLKRLEATTRNRLREIVLTDRRGYVVAATNKTSDFDQGPTEDPPDGEPVGVLMALYNMENIQNLVGAVSRGKGWHYELVNAEGLVIASSDPAQRELLQPASVRCVDPHSGAPGGRGEAVAPADVERVLLGDSGYAVCTTADGRQVLVGYARAKSTPWVLVSDTPLDEAYGLLRRQLRWFLAVSVVAVAVILCVSVVLAGNVASELTEKELLAAELQTAHDMQMGLMPETHPRLPHFAIAGRCIPANHVGGDFYQYFRANGAEVLCLVDVAGHAMEAVLDRLNEALCEGLAGRTHVALAMAEVDVATGRLRFANAGCPYPCHYHQGSGEVSEICLDAYPVGVRPSAAYRAVEASLAPGDYLVLYLDGIAEAAGATGQLFGFARTVQTVRAACARGLSPQAVIDHLLQAVRTFSGATPQADDMTCVVLRMEA
ncbi:MAG: SpoIIE family protein phosphatase, partial [Candidatus Latescibacterota bacterium]